MNVYKLPEKWLGKPLKVAVLGCGGTGYYIATNLFMLQRVLQSVCASASFATIDLYDEKDIKEPNLARTGYLPYEIGMNKAVILAHRLNMALGGETFKAHSFNATKSSLQYAYDLIITATDSLSSRLVVSDLATRQHTMWLDTGVEKATASFVLGDLGGGLDRLPNSRDLFPNVKVLDDHQETSCDMQTSLARQAFGINQQVAGHAINLISQLLLGGEIKYHGGLIDLTDGRTSPINIDCEMWQSFGYDPSNKR